MDRELDGPAADGLRQLTLTRRCVGRSPFGLTTSYRAAWSAGPSTLTLVAPAGAAAIRTPGPLPWAMRISSGTPYMFMTCSRPGLFGPHSALDVVAAPAPDEGLRLGLGDGVGSGSRAELHPAAAPATAMAVMTTNPMCRGERADRGIP